MRALLCTNHLTMWSGSELVLLEVAEDLQRRGSDVRLFANLITREFAKLAQERGMAVGSQEAGLRAFDYDLVWIQHHTAPLLDYSLGPESRAATRFVFAHLSPFEPFEQPGIVAETALADLVLCNSAETEDVVIDADLRELPRRLLQNPAPCTFERARRDRDADRPRRVAAISNLPPAEVLAALQILRDRHGIPALWLGHNGERYERVTPEFLAEQDVVISIGKTIPYCLLGGVPVYCYDRFGGPGYLRPETFARAEAFNFSGRCGTRRLDAEGLVADLLGGYPDALKLAGAAAPTRFMLEPQLDQILSMPVTANRDKVVRLEAVRHRLRREVAMATLIRRHYRATPVPWAVQD